MSIKQFNLSHEMTLAWVKFIFSVLGAIALFIIIQQPESIINQKTSKESIARERAKLLFEIIQTKDPELQKQGIEILKIAYPESESPWIKKVESYIDLKATNEIANKFIKEYYELTEKRDSIKAKVNHLDTFPNVIQKEIANTNLILLEAKINEVLNALRLYKIDFNNK